MAENEKLVGPLSTKPGDSLGAEEVNTVSPKSIPDPLGYVKAKGAKGKKMKDY